jgi:hypothetical protein
VKRLQTNLRSHRLPETRLRWVGLARLRFRLAWVDCHGLDWVGFDWVGMGGVGLGWVGLGSVGLAWVWLGWSVFGSALGWVGRC